MIIYSVINEKSMKLNREKLGRIQVTAGILLLLIIASGFLAHRYSRTNVVAQKQVTHVRTKSGQFAVKVLYPVQALRE